MNFVCFSSIIGWGKSITQTNNKLYKNCWHSAATISVLTNIFTEFRCGCTWHWTFWTHNWVSSPETIETCHNFEEEFEVVSCNKNEFLVVSKLQTKHGLNLTLPRVVVALFWDSHDTQVRTKKSYAAFWNDWPTIWRKNDGILSEKSALQAKNARIHIFVFVMARFNALN